MQNDNTNTASNSTSNEIAKFFKWNLKVGDGDLGDSRDSFANIEIPKDNLIYDVNYHVVDIVQILTHS